MSDHPRQGRILAGIGITLQDARVRRGLTIEQAAADTRISARFLEALEGEQFHELPAPVYVRGFLRSYANYLKIEAQPLLDNLRLGDAPIPGPDGFVSGPRQAPQRGSQAGRGGDPFRRQSPPPPVQAPPEPVFEDEDEEPDDRPVVGTRRTGPPPVMSAPPSVGQRREAVPVQRPTEIEPEEPFGDYDEEPAYTPEEATYRSPRVAGVLLERPGAGREASTPTRVLALVAVGVLVVLFALAAAVLLTRNSGDKNSQAVATDVTPTPSYSTVVAVGSPASSRTPAGSPSPSASATSSPSPTASVSPSPTGTVTATATPVPTQAGTAPTQAPAPTETPTPTPTTAPTPTPTVPPTPTPTVVPIPPHGQGYSECSASDCHSSDGKIYVVCAPSGYGGWFVDKDTVNGVFSNPLHWPTTTVPKSLDAEHVCG